MSKLLTEPLKCSLIELRNKIDYLEESGNGDVITKSMIDCIQHLLIETERRDIQGDSI